MAWQPTVASSISSEVAEPTSMTWGQAQRWCNFVLLEPSRLPPGLEVTALSMRPEAPPGRPDAFKRPALPDWTRSNRSAHRCVVVGDGRSVRIKQFLYDYAPPAFDHPCLWESPEVRPFEVGDHIGWCGVDFLKRAGATINLHRTTVEFSVLSGEFTREEFQMMCEGLEPVDAGACREIANTPLTVLSYQRRHEEPPIAVPVGYLAHKRSEQSRVAALTPEEVLVALLDWLPAVPPELGFRLDSAFVFGDEDRPDEIDFVLSHDRDSGRYLRILVSPRSAALGIPYPPRPEERQRCHLRSFSLSGRNIVHACADADYGQHEAVWQAADRNVMLIAKPQKWTTVSWFVDLLRAVID